MEYAATNERYRVANGMKGKPPYVPTNTLGHVQANSCNICLVLLSFSREGVGKFRVEFEFFGETVVQGL